MKSGDIILTAPNAFTVTFKGHIAYMVNGYKIEFADGRGWEKFTGTMEELLQHCTDKVKQMNKHTAEFGGTLI